MSGDLEDRFFAEVASVVCHDGWTSTEAPPFQMAPTPGRYFVDLGDGWAATACFEVDYWPVGRRWQRRDMPFVSAGVGVTCPAAERLADALRLTRCDLTLSEDAGLLSGVGELRIPVEREGDVPQAAREAATRVRATALRFARPRANVDAWMAGMTALGEDDGERRDLFHEPWVFPVMLLANGRVDDALALLAANEDALPDKLGYRDFAGDVRAFIASGAGAPPPSPEGFAYRRSAIARLKDVDDVPPRK